MASIKESLSQQLKDAMKAGDKDKVLYARNLHSAIRKKEIDDRIDLVDADVQKIISTAMKQRQDSIDQFKAGGRDDLVVKEVAELNFLKSFMPEQMGEAEVRELVKWAVAAAKAQGPKDMGAVMKVLMPKTQGKADGKLVSELVKQALGT